MKRSIKLMVSAGVLGVAAVIGIAHGSSLAEAPGGDAVGLEFTAKDDKPVPVEVKRTVKFMDTKEHKLSQEIFGTWKVDAELTKRVDGSFSGCDVAGFVNEREYAATRFVFTKDEAATKKYEESINKLLSRFKEGSESDNDEERSKQEARIDAFSKVWATGRYEIGSTRKAQGVFGIVVGKGMQMIFYFPDQKEGVPNLEATFLQIARDSKGDNDLLIYGGEFPSDQCGFLMRELVEPKDGAKADAEKPADKPAEKADKAGEPAGK